VNSGEVTYNNNNNNSDTEAVINRVVEERLAKIKANLDKAYQERDNAVRERVRLEDEAKQAKLKQMEADGKHKEIAEMKLAELTEKLALAESKVTQLTRDSAVRNALTGLDFRTYLLSLYISFGTAIIVFKLQTCD